MSERGQATEHDRRPEPGGQGDLHDRGAEEPGDGPASQNHRRSVRSIEGGQGGDGRPRDTGRSRQRRRVPDDQRELPLELKPVGAAPRLKSLYVEPESPPPDAEPAALELIDVFKIFRSGPTETVALR